MEAKTFLIVYHYPKSLRLKVECIYKSNQIERYKVSGKNRYIILQNDIPFLEAKSVTGRLRGKPKWKLIEGEMFNAELLISIIKELEYKRKNI